MRKFNDPFIPGKLYHVFNRAVGCEQLFPQHENYLFYLSKMEKYILPVADIFCYALLPNHFHLFIRIKSIAIIKESLETIKLKSLHKKYDDNLSLFIAEQFANWCNSYTKSFNKVNTRKGKLFMDNLNRRIINTESYYSKIVHYIHANAVQHKLVKTIEDWKYSSYRFLPNEPVEGTNPFLCRKELLDWFGGIDGFIKFHKQEILLKK